MAITKDQVLSYGISGTTGVSGWVAQKASEAEPAVSWAAQFAADAAQWSAKEQIAVACMVLGAVGVLHRMCVDTITYIKRERDRKRRERQLAREYQWPTK